MLISAGFTIGKAVLRQADITVLPNRNSVWEKMTLIERASRQIKRANIRIFINKPHAVIVQSYFVAHKVSQELGCRAPIVIPCPGEQASRPSAPLRPLLLGNMERVPHFLCLPSFATHNNVEILFRVAEVLRSRRKKACLVLTLDEKDLAVRSFIERINESGLLEFIINTGTLDFEEADAWFEICEALLLPTKLESFGLPFVESLARNRPILTSDLPLAREICKTGTEFFDPDNPISIANAIEFFISKDGI